MLYLRICVSVFLLGFTKGSFFETVGRSLYRPSLENKTLFGTDCITQEKKLDIAFVLDVSVNVQYSDFVELRNFVLYTTKVLELEANKTRVSVILSSGSSTTIISFHEGIDHKLFSDYLRSRMIYISSPFSFLMLPVLDYLKDRVFVEANGARDASQKAVIWITSSNNANTLMFKIKYEVLAIDRGVRFFVVAISTRAKMSEVILKKMVQSDSDYIYLDSYNLLATCEVLNDALIKAYNCDPCLPNPCLRATCVALNSTMKYRCECSPGRRGRLCELQDYCYPNPCNGGTCINPVSNTIVCTCPFGRTGVRCETIQATCPSNYCKHGGTCTNHANGTLSCACSSFFVGVRCQYVNICRITNPCKNGGSCEPGSMYPYVCNCVQPYSGKNCEKDPCTLKNPCYNGGSCIYNHAGKYYWCTCSIQYTGQHCEALILTSASTVTTSTTTITMTTLPAPVSQINCASRPCLNGGTCFDIHPGQYYCHCKSDCGGTVCEICVIPTTIYSPIIDACIPNPCKGDCQCIKSSVHESGYYCQSQSGLLGKDCNVAKPTLECMPSAVHIKLSQDILKQYMQHNLNEGVVVVGPKYDPLDSCVVNTHSGTNYKITVAFSSCGTLRMVGTNGITHVGNTVWLYHRKGNSFTMPIPLFRFRCAYSDDEYRLVSALKSTLSLTTPVIGGEVSIKPVIILCKIPVCPTGICPQELTVTGGAVYTIGEFIHLSLGLEHLISQSSGIVTSVKKLVISCSAMQNPPSFINVIENGCPLPNSNLPLMIQQNSIGKWACLSFAVPRMQQCNSVYLHATLQTCSKNLQRVCADGKNFACPISISSRRKRSSEDFDKYVVIIGPLLIINGSFGVPVVQLYPKEKAMNILINDDPVSVFPTVSTILLVLLFLVVLFIILRSLFSYCKH